MPLREPRRQGAPLRHDTYPRHSLAARVPDWPTTIMIKRSACPVQAASPCHTGYPHPASWFDEHVCCHPRRWDFH